MIVKKRYRLYKIKRFLLKVLSYVPLVKKKAKRAYEKLEEPMLYSNIYLRNVKHVVLTKDLLCRENFRFAYKSVMLIDEMSLICDQMDYKEKELSEVLSAFWKLFRHETRGGIAIVNSQSTSDLHYSIKYVLSDYFYIHHKTRLPFISLLAVEECKFSADQSSLQVSTTDVEKDLKHIVVLNKYFKYYDTYCYSIFTDDLPVYSESIYKDRHDSLKNKNLVTMTKNKLLTEKKGEKKDDK